MRLVNPHGPEKRLMPLLLTGAALAVELRRAATLPRVPMTSRETSDLIMLGIGAFTPLAGFMETRMENVRETLNRLALEAGRVRVLEVAISDSAKIPALLEELVETVKRVGPNPLKGF